MKDGLNSFLRSVAGNLVLKTISIPAGFLLTLVLANWLGAAGFGEYSVLLSIVALVCAGNNRVFNVLLPREISAAIALKREGYITGVTLFCLLWMLAAVGIVSLAIFVLETFGTSVPSGIHWLILLTLASVLAGAALRGLSWIAAGMVVEQILRTVVQLLMICVIVWLFVDLPFTLEHAQMTLTISLLISAALGFVLLLYIFAAEGYLVVPQFDPDWLLKSAPTLLAIGYVGGLNSQLPILLTGALSESREVADYKVAIGISSFITLTLLSVNMVLGPRLSKLSALNDMKAFQHLLRLSSTLVVALAIPAAILFTLFGDVAIDLLFNKEYAGAKKVLWICCLAQAVNSFCGPVVMAFNMLKREKENLLALVLAIGVGTLSGAVLIPEMGAVGTALSFLLSTLTWNIYLVVMLYLRYRVWCLPYFRLSSIFQYDING